MSLNIVLCLALGISGVGSIELKIACVHRETEKANFTTSVLSPSIVVDSKLAT